MIERVMRTDDKLDAVKERVTVLDDRLLHMSREEAKAHLDEYMRLRGITPEPGAERASKP